MYVRHLLNDSIQSSDAATFRFDLPREDMLHALVLKLRCTNGATAGRAVSMRDVVDNIQINGTPSDIIFNMIPVEYEKWYEYTYGRALPQNWTEALSTAQEMTFPILFGRHFWDREMFLPLAKFPNPQLLIDYSPTIAADGGFTTGTFSVDVVAYMSKASELGSYLGTLCKRNIRSFTTVAAGDEATLINTANRIRRIGIYCYEAATADGTDVSRVVLRKRSTGEVLYESDWDNFQHMNRELFGGSIRHQIRLFAQNDDTIDTRIANARAYGIELFAAHDVTADTFALANIDAITGDRFTLDTSIADVTAGAETHTADATDRAWRLWVEAETSGFFGFLPYVGRDVPEDYLDPLAYRDLEVLLTQGGAGGDARISIEELRKF